MSQEIKSESELSIELKRGIQVGFKSSILYLFILIPAWGALSLFLMINVHQSKLFFVLSAFCGWGFLIFKFYKVYKRSIVCPRCNNPYNMSNDFSVRIPFVKKCQSCGLPVGGQKKM